MLTGKNADHIWQHCNDKLTEDGFKALGLLKQFNTECICTSDDLTDDISLHRTATNLKMGVTVLPSLRSDAIISFEAPSFKSWLNKLAGEEIESLADYKFAIIKKLDSYKAAGCRLADHSLDAGFVFVSPDEIEGEKQFAKVLAGEMIQDHELLNLKSVILVFLGKEYARRSWIMQLHIGAHRYTSSRLRKLAGPAGGYASLGKTCDIGSLASFLDTLEQDNLLPRTILYTLNPADNEAFATLTGSYAQDGVAGKVQFGPAWWYNDHYEGIRQQLTALSSYGLMGHFVGMTTDSRSLLSFSRHEYFRRVVCNLIGEWTESGLLPNDAELLNGLVADISYYNSKRMIEGR
jgi:glucuronate isomerase